MFVFKPHGQANSNKENDARAVQLEALTSGHLTIDLAATPVAIPQDRDVWFGESVEWAKQTEHVEQQCNFVEHVFMMSDVQSSCIHGHSPCFSSPSCPSQAGSMSERLENLAQRLSHLRRRHQEHVQSCTSGMRRSQTGGIPMLRSTQDREDEEQPICDMGRVQSVWPSSAVHGQGWQWTRTHPTDGSRSSAHQADHGISREDDSCKRDDSRHRQWQDDGNQGDDAANGHQSANCPEHDLGRVREEAGALRKGRWEHNDPIEGDVSHQDGREDFEGDVRIGIECTEGTSNSGDNSSRISSRSPREGPLQFIRADGMKGPEEEEKKD